MDNMSAYVDDITINMPNTARYILEVSRYI